MTMKKKILIVDDEPNIVMSLDYLLRKNNFEVFIARNGNEALKLLDSEVPDLMLLDIMMPDVDGYEVCMHVKSNEKYKGVKVVFLSAKSKQEDIEKGYAMGADLYLTKPFSTRNLVKSIEKELTKNN